jgi:DNA-binding MarR family transcriptional regulator
VPRVVKGLVRAETRHWRRRSKPEDQGEAVDAAPQTAIDLGPLASAVGYLLRRAQLAAFQDLIDRLAQFDIRPAQYSAMLVCDRNPGLKHSQVSEALGIQRTNFVDLFDRLEQRGLAVRKPAPSDRRCHALYLTPKGKALLAHLNALQHEHEHRLTEAIGPEGREQLVALLGKVIDGMHSTESITVSAAE